MKTSEGNRKRTAEKQKTGCLRSEGPDLTSKSQPTLLLSLGLLGSKTKISLKRSNSHTNKTGESELCLTESMDGINSVQEQKGPFVGASTPVHVPPAPHAKNPTPTRQRGSFSWALRITISTFMKQALGSWLHFLSYHRKTESAIQGREKSTIHGCEDGGSPFSL